MKIFDIQQIVTGKKLKTKQIKKIHMWVRFAIQFAYFVFLPSVYSTAFAGVKYMFTQIGAGKSIELTAFLTVLLVLCGYTILFGRFFCGFACAFGSLGDWIHAGYVWCFKKRKKKPILITQQAAYYLSMLKYVVLLCIVCLCFAGVYHHAQGTSPWDVFSMLHAGNLGLEKYIIGSVVLLLLLVGMCFQERFFCRNLCPMGAVFAILPVLPFFSLHRTREECIKGCSGCTRICPSGIGLPSDGDLKVEGDCFQCQKCIDVCPKKHIHTGTKVLAGNEWWFTVIRAVLLFGLMIWAGI